MVRRSGRERKKSVKLLDISEGESSPSKTPKSKKGSKKTGRKKSSAAKRKASKAKATKASAKKASTRKKRAAADGGRDTPKRQKVAPSAKGRAARPSSPGSPLLSPSGRVRRSGSDRSYIEMLTGADSDLDSSAGTTNTSGGGGGGGGRGSRRTRKKQKTGADGGAAATLVVASGPASRRKTRLRGGASPGSVASMSPPSARRGTVIARSSAAGGAGTGSPASMPTISIVIKPPAPPSDSPPARRRSGRNAAAASKKKTPKKSKLGSVTPSRRSARRRNVDSGGGRSASPATVKRAVRDQKNRERAALGLPPLVSSSASGSNADPAPAQAAPFFSPPPSPTPAVVVAAPPAPFEGGGSDSESSDPTHGLITTSKIPRRRGADNVRRISMGSQMLLFPNTKPVKKSVPGGPSISFVVGRKHVDRPFIPVCEFITESLWANPISFIFRAPVDAVALGFKTYHDIVKEPMDLGTIRARLADGHYKSMAEFDYDMELMWANCYAFYRRTDGAYIKAKALEQEYRVLLGAATDHLDKEIDEITGRLDRATHKYNKVYRRWRAARDEALEEDMPEWLPHPRRDRPLKLTERQRLAASLHKLSVYHFSLAVGLVFENMPGMEMPPPSPHVAFNLDVMDDDMLRRLNRFVAVCLARQDAGWHGPGIIPSDRHGNAPPLPSALTMP